MSSLDIAQATLKSWEDSSAAKTSDLLAESFVLTGPDPVPLNKAAFLTFMGIHNVGFPNWKFNAHDWHENGDTVTATIHITATQTGVFDVRPLGLPVAPIAPTGKSPQWDDDFFTFTVKDGKVASLDVKLGERSGILGTLAQLGAQLPPT